MHIKDFDMLRPGDRVRIVSERAHNGAWPKDDAIEIISEHIHAIINVLTDLANRLDEISEENK